MKSSTQMNPALIAGLIIAPFALVAVVALSRKEDAAASDLVARELAELSRMPLDLRTRMLEVGIGIGFTPGSTIMGTPKDQASIDRAMAFADELEAADFPLVANEFRQAATTAQNRLKAY